MKTFYTLAAGIFLSATLCAQTSFKFDFGGDKPKSGWTQIAPTNLYSPVSGFGFEPGATVVVGKNSIASTNPFYFSAKLPEGNYKVTAVFGGENESATTVKAELRRLMLEKIQVASGKSAGKHSLSICAGQQLARRITFI